MDYFRLGSDVSDLNPNKLLSSLLLAIHGKLPAPNCNLFKFSPPASNITRKNWISTIPTIGPLVKWSEISPKHPGLISVWANPLWKLTSSCPTTSTVTTNTVINASMNSLTNTTTVTTTTVVPSFRCTIASNAIVPGAVLFSATPIASKPPRHSNSSNSNLKHSLVNGMSTGFKPFMMSFEPNRVSIQPLDLMLKMIQKPKLSTEKLNLAQETSVNVGQKRKFKSFEVVASPIQTNFGKV